jgi:hypothetical protein
LSEAVSGYQQREARTRISAAQLMLNSPHVQVPVNLMADAPSPQSELASKKALNSFLFHAELLQFDRQIFVRIYPKRTVNRRKFER